MNRQDRREAMKKYSRDERRVMRAGFMDTLASAAKATELERTVVADGPVTLDGGPMDGTTVAPDAPALQPDWHTTWPPSIQTDPGRYVLDGETAIWESIAP